MKSLNVVILSTLSLFAIGIPTADAQAQAPKKVQAKKSFSPKMLVYENLNDEKVLRRFRKRFTQLDSLLNHTKSVNAPIIDLRSERHNAESQNTDSLYWAKTAHEQLALKRHNGFEVTGQTYVRPENAFDSDNDTEGDVSKYKAKIQGEVGWNYLNSKFYQTKAKNQKIALDNELDRLQGKKRITADIYDKAADELTEQYNYYIGTTIAHRLANLDLMNEAYQYMLENDRISNDKILKVMNDKLEAEYDLSVLCASSDIQNKPIYEMKPSKVEVDTTALWKYINDESLEARIKMVKVQIADNQSKLTNYMSTARITPFIRWNTYWTSANKISNNFDAGIRFTLPLYNESGRKKQALETEKEIIQATRDTEIRTVKQECLILTKRIENLNNAIATEAFHIKQTGKYIAMRRKAYLNQKDGYNYLMRMEEYTGFLQSMERMYKLMLNRGLAIISIEKATGLTNSKDIFKEIEL